MKDTLTTESLSGKGEFILRLANEFADETERVSDLKIVGPLDRNKNQTIETALKNWIATHGEKDKAYLAVTIISDLYQSRARQITEVKLLKKL